MRLISCLFVATQRNIEFGGPKEPVESKNLHPIVLASINEPQYMDPEEIFSAYIPWSLGLVPPR